MHNMHHVSSASILLRDCFLHHATGIQTRGLVEANAGLQFYSSTWLKGF